MTFTFLTWITPNLPGFTLDLPLNCLLSYLGCASFIHSIPYHEGMLALSWWSRDIKYRIATISCS
ncbi:hypothetical protein CCR75_008504 [Bremia lactucae]|uniref:Uncharacterized protein n=1 Tax=Bremia lactucae TaxID=4779 RepID=A0A976IEB1_BRELC|nr:hypothetical protein CCR75_008504 [Bremia lactucae]